MKISEKLKFLRKEKKLNQTDLAQAIRTSQAAITQIETDRRTPSKKIACDLASFFNVSVETFLTDAPLDQNQNKKHIEINDLKRFLRITEMLNHVLMEENINDWSFDKKFNLVSELYEMGLGQNENGIIQDTAQIKTSIKLAKLVA